MASRRLPTCTPARGAARISQITWIAALVVMTTFTGLASVRADDEQNPRSLRIDTEHMFGFTEGSDIGYAGDRELEAETIGHFGGRDGSYNAAATALEAKFTLSDSLLVGLGATPAYFDIAGVTGLSNQRRGALQSVLLEARYRLLDRTRAPFGLTFVFEPLWGLVDDESGAAGRQYGGEFRIAMDRELIPDRIFAAFNLLYDPSVTNVYGSGTTERQSTVGTGLAMTGQVWSGFFLGAEARLLRRYEDVGLDHFSGQAFYLGPTLYAHLGGTWYLTASWNLQVVGRAADGPGALDLTHFERYQALLRISGNF
jgi:hypothetical protein